MKINEANAINEEAAAIFQNQRVKEDHPSRELCNSAKKAKRKVERFSRDRYGSMVCDCNLFVGRWCSSP